LIIKKCKYLKKINIGNRKNGRLEAWKNGGS